MAKLLPGSEVIIWIMFGLLEAAKLTTWALISRPIPRLLKCGLIAVGLILVISNTAGVAAFLSNSYSRIEIENQAHQTVGNEQASSHVQIIEKQLEVSEKQLAASRTELLKSRDD